MLQISAVKPDTFRVLENIMALPEMAQFTLVGGTSLALQIGHRLSIDLDFFTANTDFDPDELMARFREIGQATLIFQRPHTLKLELDGIKLDILKYPAPLLEPPILENGLRLISVKDIIAMKLSAIVSRGAKKDFVDVFYLLKQFRLSEMLNFYERKFGISEFIPVHRSLLYFDDADRQEDPILLTDQFSWGEMKRAISREVQKTIF